MSKFLCHLVYGMFNKQGDDFQSKFYKHDRIPIADIKKTSQYNINILKNALQILIAYFKR
jgi:hypothetical protein